MSFYNKVIKLFVQFIAALSAIFGTYQFMAFDRLPEFSGRLCDEKVQLTLTSRTFFSATAIKLSISI